MKLGSAALLMAAAVMAFGAFAAGTPAGAQETTQQTPWYMPQAWVHPPQTGPKVRKLPGYYGHSYRNRSYGGFGNGCYGDCRELPGTISTGYGVTLAQPIVAIFDPRAYQLVPHASYEAAPPPPAMAAPVAAPVQPLVVPVGVPTRRHEPQATFAMQNGVRVIRPARVEAY